MKFYYYYSAMNAGKTTSLLQSAYNYQERGMKTLLLIPAVVGKSRIESRIGLSSDAMVWDADTFDASLLRDISCVFVDEAQFLTKAQVTFLASVVDISDIPVQAYGLRTDFKGEPFEGSKYLLAWADEINEIKTTCSCSKKATMNIRIDADGKRIDEGAQVQIGHEESYISVCRSDFFRSSL